LEEEMRYIELYQFKIVTKSMVNGFPDDNIPKEILTAPGETSANILIQQRYPKICAYLMAEKC